MLKNALVAAALATAFHAAPVLAASVDVVAGTAAGFSSQAEARFRNLRGGRNSEQVYVGENGLGSAAVRDQKFLNWSQQTSWSFAFDYDAITGVAEMGVGGVTASFDIGDNGAPVNALFLELRDGSKAPGRTGTMSIENVSINGMAPAAPNLFAVNDSTESWTFLFDPSTTFAMTGDFNIAGSWSGSQEGNKVTFKTGSVPAPIPLPAAAWLLMGGLASLGAFARRR